MKKKNILLGCAVVISSFLAGCTVTGEPRYGEIVYEASSIADNEYANSVSVNKLDGFVGTSSFSLSGRVSPNLSEDRFRKILSESLEKAGLSGSEAHLDVVLKERGNWSHMGIAIGTRTRELVANITLSKNGEVVLDKEVEGYGDIRNFSPVAPYYLLERQAAEEAYLDLISNIIEEIKTL